jgi:small subunit ribosomal protein S4
MSRYTGPRLKIARRLGQYLPGLSRKAAKRRQNPPGQHGANRGRKRSDYCVRLEEKQKVRFNYGLTERQLRRFFAQANRMKGDTGHNLMQLLESRLDSVLFRAGFAPTIPAARQIIAHGHVRVNGRRVDVASHVLHAGQTITLDDKAKKLLTTQAGQEQGLTVPPFLSIDRDKFEIGFVATPSRPDVLLDVEEN